MMPVPKNRQWIRKNDGEANGKEQNQVEKEKERLIRPSHEQEVCFWEAESSRNTFTISQDL